MLTSDLIINHMQTTEDDNVFEPRTNRVLLLDNDRDKVIKQVAYIHRDDVEYSAFVLHHIDEAKWFDVNTDHIIMVYHK